VKTVAAYHNKHFVHCKPEFTSKGKRYR